MALKAEVWVEAVTEGGRRFMAAWREEEEDAARLRQEKRQRDWESCKVVLSRVLLMAYSSILLEYVLDSTYS